MHCIPPTFTQGQWVYTFIVRYGDLAIYRQARTDGLSQRFELIRVHQYAERQVFGGTAEAGEYYPTSREWGRFGRTYFTLAEAQGALLHFL